MPDMRRQDMFGCCTVSAFQCHFHVIIILHVWQINMCKIYMINIIKHRHHQSSTIIIIIIIIILIHHPSSIIVIIIIIIITIILLILIRHPSSIIVTNHHHHRHHHHHDHHGRHFYPEYKTLNSGVNGADF